MALIKTINSGYKPYIVKGEVVAPFTTIINRQGVDGSFKAVFATERIHVNSLQSLPKESDNEGRPCFAPDNGDSRVRFIGYAWISEYSTRGMGANTLANSDGDSFIEVTFYGTGLNILTGAFNTSQDFSASIDGGAFGANIFPNFNNVTDVFNTKSNTVTNVVRGLTIGWHTVRLRQNDTIVSIIYGFDILNESSQISVLSGAAYGDGYEYINNATQLIDYNIGFENEIDANLGTKGGRAIIYIDPIDGVAKKVITKTGVSKTLASSDYSNSHLFRIINGREFGRRRADDFSTLAGTSDRTFTLDDGTTTLMGNAVNYATASGITGLSMNTTSAYLQTTFTGTGMSISVATSAGFTNVDEYEFFVDGASVGTLTDLEWGFTDGGRVREIKIFSDYDNTTHVVKVVRNTGVKSGVFIRDFRLYRDKKPVLPKGAIEIADYNVMADFVANTTTGIFNISKGVVRKCGIREFSFQGTWLKGIDITASLNITNIFGWRFSTTTVGGFVSLPILGTGFDMRFVRRSTHAQNALVEIDDGSGFKILNVTNFPSITKFETYAGAFDTATGILNQTGADEAGAGFGVSGLPFGSYTLRITKGATGTLAIETVDVITPTFGSSTHFGSNSMIDVRNFDSSKNINKAGEKRSEANVNFNGVSQQPQGSRGVSQLLKDSAGRVYIYLEEPMTSGSSIVAFTTSEVTSRVRDLTGAGEFKDNPRSVYYAESLNSVNTNTDALWNWFTITGILEKDKLEE